MEVTSVCPGMTALAKRTYQVYYKTINAYKLADVSNKTIIISSVETELKLSHVDTLY